jgi:hypothetical protein
VYMRHLNGLITCRHCLANNHMFDAELINVFK